MDYFARPAGKASQPLLIIDCIGVSEAFIGHDDCDGCVRVSARDPVPHEGRCATCRPLENTVVSQQGMCGMICGIGANPMNLVDQVMSDINGNDAVSQPAQHALAHRLAEQHTAMGIDSCNLQMWVELTQERTCST